MPSATSRQAASQLPVRRVVGLCLLVAVILGMAARPAQAAANATAVAWGQNTHEQTTVPAGLTNLKAVAAGTYHTLALKDDGTVVAWGDNSAGKATVPAGLSGVVSIAAGWSHSLAAKSDGTVVQWGGFYPVPLGLSGVTAVEAGENVSLALKSNGTVVVWGPNGSPQTVVPADVAGVVAIAAGNDHCVALRGDGSVVVWGSNSEGQTTVPNGLGGVVAVAAGFRHTIALKNDGTVVAWGENWAGQSAVPNGLTGVVAIAGGEYHTLAVKNDGTVVTWGANGSPQSMIPAGLTGAFAVSAGRSHSVAVRLAPEVVGWGYNHRGQITIPTGLSGVTAIAAGESHSAALKNDGTVAVWGADFAGQTTIPNGLSGVTAIAAASNYTLALRSNGTVAAWGQSGWGSMSNGVSNARAIAAGKFHALAARNDGTLVGWGRNDYGQAVAPQGLTGVNSAATGDFHSLALKSDGTVVAWGHNHYGQSTVPPGLTGVIAVAAGQFHSVALKEDGTVMAWGLNTSGISTVPAGLTNVRAIAAYANQTLALKYDGAVVAWGENQYGQITIPANLPPASGIAAGTRHTVALISPGAQVPDIRVTTDSLTGGLVEVPNTQAFLLDLGATPMDFPLLQAFTIKNNGAGALTGLTVSFEGLGKFHYMVDQAPATTVAPGASTTFVIKFLPWSPGEPLSATVRIASNDPDENPFDIRVSASGVNAPVAIKTQPRPQIVAVGAPIAMSVAVRGEAPLKFQWRKNGVNLAGATSSTYPIASAALANAGGYSAQVKSKHPGAVVSQTAEVAVVNPAAKALTLGTGGTATFSIAAAGNGLVFDWLHLGVPLTETARIRGVNTKTLTIRSLELGDEGDYRCRVTGPGGVLIGNANGLVVFSDAPLITKSELAPDDPIAMPDAMVGRAYEFPIPVEVGNQRLPTRFTAVGLPAGLTVDALMGVISGKPTVSKTAAYRITLTAANAKGTSTAVALLTVQPMKPGTAGSYVALFGRDTLQNGDLGDLGGRLDLTVHNTAAFTGNLRIGATPYSFKGVLETDFDAAPFGHATIVRRGLPAIQIDFTLDSDAGTLFGSVDDGGGDVGSGLTGWRQVWNGTSNPVITRLGRHVFGLDLDPVYLGADALPQGSGFGTAVVTRTGGVTVTGQLADGSTITSNAPLGPQGEVLVFTALSSNTGSLIGQLQLQADEAHSLSGSLDWMKRMQTALSERDYRNGFGPVLVTANGGSDQPLLETPLLLGLPDAPDNARLLFTHGGLEFSPINPDVTFRITKNHTAVMPKADSDDNRARATFSLTRSTGQFSGTFQLTDTPPDSTRPVTRFVKFQGMVVPSPTGQARGYGYFLMPALPDSTAIPPTTLYTSPVFSGRVVLEPTN